MDKKKIFISIGAILALCIILLVGTPKIKKIGTKETSNTETAKTEKVSLKEKYNEVIPQANCGIYDYEDLIVKSHIIALVEVMDELTEKNSEALIDQGTGIYIGEIGRRQVKVLEYFKDERHYGDTLTIIDGAAIIDGNYIHSEDYAALEKGTRYLIFLNDDNYTNELSTISDPNSVFNVDDLNENERFYDVQIKAIIDLLSDLSEKEKKEIVNADIEKTDNDIIKISDKKVTIKIGKEKKEIYIKKGSNGKLTVNDQDSQKNQNQNNQGQNSQGNKNQQ